MSDSFDLNADGAPSAAVFGDDGLPITPTTPTVAAGTPAAPTPVVAAAPAALPPQPVAAPLVQAAGPEPAPPAVPSAPARTTREPLPYLVNGSEHSLIRDAWATRDGDADAAARLRRFQGMVAAGALVNAVDLQAALGMDAARMITAAADTTGAAGVTPLWDPPGYRPDLYVEQITFPTPLVDAVAHAPISDATPFRVPSFTSGPGTADVATEGTNPATGNLVSALVTITPKAVSGIYDASRELIDSSAAGVAVDRIAMSAMREDYSQDLEQRLATELAAASNGVDVPLGAAPTIPAYFIALRQQIVVHAARRGMAPTHAFSPGNVFGALAGADRADGSPILPWNAYGTTNVDGTQGQALSANIMGVPYDLAWKLASLVSVLLTRQDVWAFTSPVLQFRMEEVLGPAQIRLALWGYQAVRVLRPSGVTRITHTGAPLMDDELFSLAPDERDADAEPEGKAGKASSK
jgi:hypothetical protein